MIHPTKRDLLGAACSGLCLVQCLAPLLLISLGYQAAWLSSRGEQVHLAFLFLVPAIALWSFLPGFRCHRSRRPLLLAAAAFPPLVCGVVIGGNLEVPLTIAGGLLMITAHIDNRRQVLATAIPTMTPILRNTTGGN